MNQAKDESSQFRKRIRHLFRPDIDKSNRLTIINNIIDIQGRLVNKLVQNSYTYGEHEVMFDANVLSSGIYFVQLITEKDIKYSKIVLLK